MLVYRKSTLSKKINSMDIDVTMDKLRKIDAGAAVMKVLPGLTHEQKAFMISGITPEEWSGLFKNKSTGNAIGGNK